METLAVTGAAGVVGSVVVEHCAAAGYYVLAIDHREPPAALKATWQSVGSGRIVPAQLDVRDGDSLSQAFHRHGVTAVMHLAAITAGPDREREAPESIVDVNINGSLAMLRAAREAEVRRFIQVSSNAVYGVAAHETDLIDEEKTTPKPDALYGITKLAGEGIVRRQGDLWDLDVRVARLSSVFGPWEHATGARDTLNPIFQATVAALTGQPARFTRPCRRDWIYNRDVASALLALLESDRLQSILYHVAPGPTAGWTVEDWCRRLATRFSDFTFEVVDDPSRATINLHEPADRAPMNNRRLITDTGFQPAFDIDAAFTDLMAWIDTNRDFWA